MAEIVNLRQARKRRARDTARAEADANAARHGRARSDREAAEALDALARRNLDGHRLDGDDD